MAHVNPNGIFPLGVDRNSVTKHNITRPDNEGSGELGQDTLAILVNYPPSLSAKTCNTVGLLHLQEWCFPVLESR